MPARQVLLSEAGGLVQRFGVLHGRLEEIRRGVEQPLPDLVGEVNARSVEVARLNIEIVRVEGATGGQPANDLRDQRDELVRALSSLVGVSVVMQDGDVMNVSLRTGQALVVGSTAVTLAVIPNRYDITRGEVAVQSAGNTIALPSTAIGGEIGALLDFRERILDPAENMLGQTALGLARSFNHQHQLGQDLNGDPGQRFFNRLDVVAPRVFGHVANSGAPPATLDIEIIDVSALTASDYELTRAGAAYTLTRLSDGTATVLAGFPGATEQVDGLSIRVGAGTIADGDRFLIQPSRDAARALDLDIVAAGEVAAAAPVRAAASLANAGSATISQPRVNTPDHELAFTFTSPTTVDVVDATTGAVLESAVTYVPGGPLTFNGVTVSINGAPDPGDVFRVDHTVSAAAAGNTGSGSISVATLGFPDPNLTDTVTITFDAPPGTFTVTGSTTGGPTAAVPYTSGDPISFNGWTVIIDGSSEAGDTFTIGPNLAGVGDNRNVLALGDLQTGNTLAGGTATFAELNGQLIARVGTIARQTETGLAAQDALLEQANRTRSEVSGVNLDQEAADLLRFQQAYQANARVISLAAETFQTLLRAVSRA